MKHRALQHIITAERAYAKGVCLTAGQEIDKAYLALGRKPSKPLSRRLERLDARFERHCVRRRPR